MRDYWKFGEFVTDKMKTQTSTSGSDIRKRLPDLLGAADWDAARNELLSLPAQRTAKVLQAFIADGDPAVKWRAVVAMGMTVVRLADENMESARNIIRRLFWSLNEESGGMGWGAAEAIGETIARHEGLAGEFGPLLTALLRVDGCNEEFIPMQRGALWAVARVAETQPHAVNDATPLLASFLASPDAETRALAALAAGRLLVTTAINLLQISLKDQTEIILYYNAGPQSLTVASIAQEALRALEA